ncbi:MAG: putative metal-dependent hydrolase [Arenicella sp.]|jgi:predicted metal-dependent hydrolase
MSIINPSLNDSFSPSNSPAASPSRSKLEIVPRRVKFEFSDFDGPFYYNGNSCISAMWVAMSASFPAGEAEFIKSVKLFENQITDPKLRAEVQAFAHQEAHHSLQHRQVNKMFDELGYETGKLNDFFKVELKKREQKWSPEKRLARTVCAEHVTAVMANHALTHPEHMKHFPESFRNLFLWHAIEEIEHKSVAFDVYQQCVGDQKLLRQQYKIFTRFEFPFNIWMSSRFLLKKLGRKATWKERKELWASLYGDGGLISDMRGLYKQFLQPGFHPWDHDDSALVEQWKKTLAPHFTDH